MKRYISAICIALLAICSVNRSVAQEPEHYFPYPVVPEQLTTLSERCNYLVFNFWERCNIKQSFSSKSKLDEAFGDWIGLMPYASSDTVYLAIDNYLAAVAKTGGDNLLTVGEMAKKWTFTDSAEYYSEQLYLPFCRELANNKKVSKAQKAIYAAQLQKLESSSLGARIPDFDYVTPDGATKNAGDIIASRIILFFNDPDCMDCNFAKARLSADYNLNQLIQKGLVKVISIYPGEATAEWAAEVLKYPANWEVGASEDIDLYFDLSVMPAIYYIDSRHKVLGKDVPVDNILVAMRQINETM